MFGATTLNDGEGAQAHQAVINLAAVNVWLSLFVTRQPI